MQQYLRTYTYAVIVCILLITASKPTVKVLQSSGIISAIGPNWFELGIALLDDDQVAKLEAIRADHSETNTRCTRMLLCWLTTHSNATWNDLIVALTSKGVELNDVVVKVKALFHG